MVAALLAFAVCEKLVWKEAPWIQFCARYASPFRASDPLRTYARIRLLPQRERQPPILLVGSSQILEGLDCEIFQARFPGRLCANLGVAAGSPLDLLYLTDQIDRRLERRVLITGIFPQTLHRPPKAAFTDLKTLGLVLRSGAWLHMSATDWIDAIYGQMQNLCETLRVKDSLRDMWDVVGPDPLAAVRFELPPPPPRTLDDRPRRPPSFFREGMGVVDPVITPGPFTRAHEMALDAVIDREIRRGNRMLVIDFPTHRGYESTITPEAVEHHRRLVERLAARPGIVMVQAADLPPLVDRDFHDFTHLDPKGRQKVSERVAEILARVGG